MLLTHTKVAGCDYELKLFGQAVAPVTKHEAGWDVTVNGVTTEHKTMAAAKAHAWANLTDEAKVPPIKPEKVTLQDAFRMLGFSHTAMYTYVRELAKIWPTLPKPEYGARLMRMGMESRAESPDLYGQMAKDWLVRHPELGIYDRADHDQRLASIYPDNVG